MARRNRAKIIFKRKKYHFPTNQKSLVGWLLHTSITNGIFNHREGNNSTDSSGIWVRLNIIKFLLEFKRITKWKLYRNFTPLCEVYLYRNNVFSVMCSDSCKLKVSISTRRQKLLWKDNKARNWRNNLSKSIYKIVSVEISADKLTIPYFKIRKFTKL